MTLPEFSVAYKKIWMIMAGLSKQLRFVRAKNEAKWFIQPPLFIISISLLLKIPANSSRQRFSV